MTVARSRFFALHSELLSASSTPCALCRTQAVAKAGRRSIPTHRRQQSCCWPASPHAKQGCGAHWSAPLGCCLGTSYAPKRAILVSYRRSRRCPAWSKPPDPRAPRKHRVRSIRASLSLPGTAQTQYRTIQVGAPTSTVMSVEVEAVPFQSLQQVLQYMYKYPV